MVDDPMNFSNVIFFLIISSSRQGMGKVARDSLTTRHMYRYLNIRHKINL